MERLQLGFRRTIPFSEVVLNEDITDYSIDPDKPPTSATTGVFVLNTESRGRMTVQSSRPSVPCLDDLNFFSDAHDRRVAAESTREILRLSKQSAFLKDNVGYWSVPKSDGEKDILDF